MVMVFEHHHSVIHLLCYCKPRTAGRSSETFVLILLVGTHIFIERKLNVLFTVIIRIKQRPYRDRSSIRSNIPFTKNVVVTTQYVNTKLFVFERTMQMQIDGMYNAVYSEQCFRIHFYFCMKVKLWLEKLTFESEIFHVKFPFRGHFVPYFVFSV